MEKIVIFSKEGESADLRVYRVDNNLTLSFENAYGDHLSLDISSLDEWLIIRKEIDMMVDELFTTSTTDKE